MSEDNIQYLTSIGMVNLENEYRELKDNTIPNIAKMIDEAKQQGDLSENAEYQQAKEEMAWAQGRVKELEFIFNNAKIIEKPIIFSASSSKVLVGSTIKFRNRNNIYKEYSIVGPQEADPLKGKISNESPLGQAFLGKSVGEKIRVKTPGGDQDYEIVEIK